MNDPTRPADDVPNRNAAISSGASAHPAELVRETRHRWEPVDPPAPEGWRRCDFSQFSQDGEGWFVLYTNAPRDKNPHSFDTYWRRHRKVRQERFVTEWRDVETEQIDGSDGAQ